MYDCECNYWWVWILIFLILIILPSFSYSRASVDVPIIINSNGSSGEILDGYTTSYLNGNTQFTTYKSVAAKSPVVTQVTFPNDAIVGSISIGVNLSNYKLVPNANPAYTSGGKFYRVFTLDKTWTESIQPSSPQSEEFDDGTVIEWKANTDGKGISVSVIPTNNGYSVGSIETVYTSVFPRKQNGKGFGM